MAKLIAPAKALGYSDLYLDFVSGLHSARHFYSVDNLTDVIAQLDTVNYDRNLAADILKRQNTAYGASQRTLDNIELLRQPNSLCVFTGQQAGLFGGPLLVLNKALGIVKAARLYSQQLNRPVVPIFWMAGDDHDFEEANNTVVLNRQSEVVTLRYGTPPQQEVPTADIRFEDTEALQAVKDQLHDALGESDYTADLYKLIDQCYTPEETLVTAFGKLMAALTGRFGLILFSPGDASAKQAAIPFFKAIIDRQEELHEVINTANDHIARHGYHIQVEKKDNATHLFCNLGGRKPVLRQDDGRFSIGEETVDRTELLGMIEREPERFSPDVLTRPVLQSYLFPCVSQKGGPAEIAYLAQVNPIFPLFLRAAPYYAARPTATFVESRFEKMMEEYGISFEDLTGDIEQVINRVLAASFPEDIETQFKDLSETVESKFREFVVRSLKFDNQLESVAKQFYGKIDFSMKQFEAKVFAAHKRKSAETRDRIYRLYNTLYTNRVLQERALNVTYFLARYGMDFLAFVYDQLDSEERSHQLISLSEYNKQ